MKFRELRSIIIKDYAVIPFIFCGIGQAFVYYFPRLINGLYIKDFSGYYDFSTAFDNMIPAVSYWAVIYFLSYLFWAVSYVTVALESREMGQRLLVADLMGKCICFVIFIAVPTAIIRPEVPQGECFSWLLELLYAIDTPDNLLPSMHCSVSWFAMRFVLKSKKPYTWYKVLAPIFTLLIFASVLFTKQHIVIDIAAGVLVAELCTQIACRTNIHKFLDKLDVETLIYRRINKSAK